LLPIRELDFDVTAELRTWLTVIDKYRCTTLVVGL
jgi:ABC-type sulfate/molybdate transport systems ATPase subunit